MTVLGIVGCAEDKFTTESEERARMCIRAHLYALQPELVVSGGCPLGGIDKWAIEEADKAGFKWHEYEPEVHQWNPLGKIGFMARNLQIADVSSILLNIVLDEYPPGYNGMRFPICYHCKSPGHIKSGGCWTMKEAAKRGKEAHLIVIPQRDYQWE